jgi:hypothetical protein
MFKAITFNVTIHVKCNKCYNSIIYYKVKGFNNELYNKLLIINNKNQVRQGNFITLVLY